MRVSRYEELHRIFPDFLRYYQFCRFSYGGAVYLELYNPKGEMISYDWSTGLNVSASWKFTLPSSGTYTLKIVSWTDVPVSVTAFWD